MNETSERNGYNMAILDLLDSMGPDTDPQVREAINEAAKRMAARRDERYPTQS
jgi:hypothetical protein